MLSLAHYANNYASIIDSGLVATNRHGANSYRLWINYNWLHKYIICSYGLIQSQEKLTTHFISNMLDHITVTHWAKTIVLNVNK